MSAILTMYEIRVRVKTSPYPKGYNCKNGCYFYDEIIKTFHKEAKTPEQAKARCKEYGRPISVRKVDVSTMHKDFEKLPLLNGVYQDGNPYEHAIAMDEMIWEKRNKRRSTMQKEKDTLEKGI